MDIDDIPVPVSIPVVKSNNPVPDEFDYPVAVKFGFIGLGQGGGRLAETFYKLGYRNVVAINTTDSDLKQIKIPEENKLNLNVGGAGKSLTAAATAAAAKREDIYALIAGKFSAPPELTFLCFGMGGGTGAGIAPIVQEVVTKFNLDNNDRAARIGAIVALPKADEGATPTKNALDSSKWLLDAGLSPILLLDNDRVIQLYRPSLQREYSVGNAALAGLLHSLNRLAATPADHTTFDKADFLRTLGDGVTVLGSQPIATWSDGNQISQAIRQSIATSLLADVDVSQATVSSLIFMCGPDAYDTLEADALEKTYAMFGRMFATKATVFRGVYTGEKPGLVALYAAGGLVWPAQRLLNVLNRS